jgi:hypothetical protein
MIAALGDENKRLAKGQAIMLGHLATFGRRAFAPVGSGKNWGEGKTTMKMIAYLLAIICAIAAVMYFVMPAGQLPTFMPGYADGSTHIHTSHAIAAAVGAVVLAAIGKFVGR